MSLPEGIQKVVDGGYCIGCGACAALSPEKGIAMELSSQGVFLPIGLPSPLTNPPVEGQEKLLRICPFSDETRNEDELAVDLFPNAPGKSPGVGRYIECFAGRVADEGVYQASSSGGLARWLLAELLSRDKVDYVINVVTRQTDEDPGPHYFYAVHESAEEVLNQSAKSAYYPVELSKVLALIDKKPGRYAITGVPCFIKALRNIAAEFGHYRDRIKFTCGVICGHQKSTWYAEMIGWQLGVLPEELGGLDFRVKIPGARANEKGVQAWMKDGKPGSGPKIVQELFGTTYAHGFFKNSACEFCDDVTAELADVSFGDAWLPEYLTQGTSLVIVRNPEIHEILMEGMASSALILRNIEAASAEEAQAGGLRDRREGLSYRLAERKKQGIWVPRKRVPASTKGIPQARQKIYRTRSLLTKKSFEFFSIARVRMDWNLFEEGMRPFLRRYSQIHAGPLKSVWLRLRKLIEVVARRLRSN